MKSAEDKVRALINEAKIETGSGADERTLADALSELEKMRQKRLTRSRQNIWRITMKSPIVKLAAAAVVIVAVLIGVHFISNPFGTTVTFAKVIQPILNAHTVVLDFIAGKEEESGPVIHDIIVGNKIRRTLSNMETIMIIDLDNARMLTLDPKTKGAAYVDIQGPLQEGTKNLLELVRNIVTNLKDLPAQELGQRNIDGHKAIGFRESNPNVELTIWADPKTAQPIRIELLLAQKSLYILKNIEFDVQIDESLVSMDIPADYTLSKTEVNLRDFTEQDFIEGLRIWAELLLNGNFPESISVEDYLKLTPLVGEKISQLNVSDEEGTRLGMSFGRGMIFFQQLDPYGIDWHYAGSGVKLGDASKAIFWYQPKGSQTYRVIYGNLTVKDVKPEDLPK
jgi:outer membrane lipoprotein-sorting protein